MGLFVLFNAALAGFFAFASVHYVVYWWLSRRETTFLIFSLHCALCAVLSGYRVAIAIATTIPAMATAFSGRTTMGLLIAATSVCILSRLTGVRAHRYVAFVVVLCPILALLNAAGFPVNGPITQIDTLTLPWGEVISIPARTAAPWWMGPIFAVILSVYLFGVLASLRLWARDRIGGTIVGLASLGGLVTIVVAFLADVAGWKLPYIGPLPQALSVVMIALLQSREMALDISERKRAEETLRESEARYRTLVEFAPEAILVLDVDQGTFVDVNDNACRMFKMSRDELLRLGPLSLSPPNQPDGRASAEKAREQIELAVAGEAVRVEWACRDGSGREIPCEISLVRLPSASRRLVRGSVNDLTQTKRLQEQFRQAQKMEAVGQLAGGIAHDFNNLLTIIFGYCEALLAKLPATDRSRSAVDAILEAGERAASLTRQLLAFSRQQVLQPKALNLNTVVTTTETMLRRLIGEDVILTADLDPHLGIVKADPSQLEQVLMNLAVNARDAMPKGGKLTIETRNVTLDETFSRSLTDVPAGPYSMLTVTDTGIGMDDATRARAFEPFFTTKGPGKGTGLGLATVHGIVRQSGGHVDVASKVAGGTSVRIYLPQIAMAPTGQLEPASPDMPRGSETVLLVEDETAVRELGQRILKSCGYTVLVAHDGHEALRIAGAQAGQIDILVSDVVMPHLGGKQLAERIALLRPSCKVLFLSGYTADAVLRHGVGEAEFDFLQKPFTATLLAQKVREVLNRSRNVA